MSGCSGASCGWEEGRLLERKSSQRFCQNSRLGVMGTWPAVMGMGGWFSEGIAEGVDRGMRR